MNKSGYCSQQELKKMGLAGCGKNVRIARSATLYNPGQIYISDNVRIDNFSVLAPSGKARLVIGNYVHIGAFSFINGLADIRIGDFSTLAPYARIFSSSDDYSGRHLTGATIPESFLGTFSRRVILRKHVIVGTGSALMPGVELGEGTAVGAYSLVKKDSLPFTVIAGVPAKYLKKRSRGLLKDAKDYLKLRRSKK